MKMMELIHGSDPANTMVDFIRFACNELGLSSLPKITILGQPVSNSPYNSFAAYRPGAAEIMLYASNRHILDVLRSLCHEMVHYRQDLAGELKPNSGITGSDQENEANAVAGQIMRKYGKIHPELF
jgi:hypothetical protein